ncbi:DUF4097 family beta strand repeat-containing protein [Agromyces sp. LHK192]|uniref:DUF4097 family beta strand repeat-containing protein n=1 Tax=Agromyces sp. LHK192 TaxID=2498704 RepID=UPI000FD9525A|nr:DUF4097 family beta strand repeat-containing protein [Agromyces sp. LHK192]
MHATTRTIAASAVVLAAALGLSGCWFMGPPQTHADDAVVTDAVTAIEIDDPAGAVTVRGVAGATEVSIERTLHYFGAERSFDATHEVDGGTLVLHGCGRNCSAEYVLEVPEGLDVSGSTANGAVELSGVHDVDVSTSNGLVELDGVTGSVEASTSNGRVVGRGLTGGGIRAASSNGAIELHLETPQDVSAETSNGSIEVDAPPASYRVDTATSNGGVEVDLANDPDGEFTFDLRTSNGSIRVGEAG